MPTLERPSKALVADDARLSDLLTSFYSILIGIDKPRLPSFVPNLASVTRLNFAGLRATPGSADGEGGPRACVVLGKTTIFDGFEGVFAWDSTSKATDDNSTTVAAAGVAVGRWRKMTLGAVASTRVTVNAFTASGTWTKPTNGMVPLSVDVIVVGGGGGGGSGRRGAALSVRCGGGGGGAGGVSRTVFVPAVLGATETVTVGASVAGGTAIALDNTSGNNGTAGNPSSFGIFLRATGGGAGGGGTAAAGTAGASGVGNTGTGGAGGAASGTGGAGVVGVAGTGLGGGGGASGAGITSGDVTSNGAVGGAGSFVRNPPPVGGTAGAGAAAGGNGASVSVNSTAGGGGGGSGASNGAGRTGGNGGSYAAGGAGGAASLNATNSGSGGIGSAGLVIVVSYG